MSRLGRHPFTVGIPLEMRVDIGGLLELKSERGAGAVWDTGRDVEALFVGLSDGGREIEEIVAATIDSAAELTFGDARAEADVRVTVAAVVGKAVRIADVGSC